MGIYSQLTGFIDNQMNNNQNTAVVFGPGRVDVSMDTNQAGSTLDSLQYQGAAGSAIIGRNPYAGLVLLRLNVAVGQLNQYIADRANHQTPYIVYDPYTESILTEAMSYQPPQSKLESAHQITKPRSVAKYKPKLAGICRSGFVYEKTTQMCIRTK